MHSLLHDFLDDLFLILNQMLSIRAFGRRDGCSWTLKPKPEIKQHWIATHAYLKNDIAVQMYLIDCPS